MAFVPHGTTVVTEDEHDYDTADIQMEGGRCGSSGASRGNHREPRRRPAAFQE